MKHHLLKINREYYVKVLSGTKTFEIRKNDRDFKEGDRVILTEIEGMGETGRAVIFNIGYVCDYEQKEDYVVFSLVEKIIEIV